MWFDQQAYDVRCEWGLHGVELLAPAADVAIIVDVLSFSTCVDVATRRGAVVYPARWKEKDSAAAELARSVDGVLAGQRSREQVSLSPTSLMSIATGTRLVIPSPNGATLSATTGRTPTLTGCLRNASAVARRAQTFGTRIAVIPAGEQWPDGTLRPSVEDWLGAGAILAHLSGALSPEAASARSAFEAARSQLSSILRGCASGRELIEGGWDDDVEVSAALNVSDASPLLHDGAYRAE